MQKKDTEGPMTVCQGQPLLRHILQVQHISQNTRFLHLYVSTSQHTHTHTSHIRLSASLPEVPT